MLTVFDIKGDSVVARMAGAAVIAMGCGTLAIAVLLRYNLVKAMTSGDATVISEITPLSI